MPVDGFPEAVSQVWVAAFCRFGHRLILADSSRPDAQTRQRKAVLHGLASAGAFGRGATAC